MTKPRFTIVTASAGAARCGECFDSWHTLRGMDGCGGVLVAQKTSSDYEIHVPRTSPTDRDWLASITVPNYLGPVPAFKLGVDLALQITAPDGVIACLHDDLLIEEPGWDAKVMAFFNLHPECGLLGFGGGTGLGSDDIYQAPYDPMQLARRDFVSNMRDAEAHGRRSTVPVRVACLDGFSQIGRVAYWKGRHQHKYTQYGYDTAVPPLHRLESLGVIHHAYDAYLGAYAAERRWQVWMLPVACHHYGGQTAVGDAGYQAWARQQSPEGDQFFWRDSHATVYNLLRGVLPIRV